MLLSTPPFMAIASRPVPLKIDLLTTVCCQPEISPLAVNPCFNAMHHHRPVIAAANVILARPHHVNGSAPVDRFHHLRHFRGPVRRGARSPPKAASAQKRVDFDLLGFHPQKLRSDHLIERLQLRARPYFRAVAVKLNHAIHRFHGRVREIRKCVLGFDRLCRARQTRRGVSATFRRNARLLHQLAILFEHLSRGALFRARNRPR